MSLVFSGADSAKVKLINNFVVAGYWWIWVSNGKGGGFVNAPAGADQGVSNVNLVMSFWTIAPGAVDYELDLYAVGPVQVAYR